MDNSIMFKLTYGLFVLTAKDGEKANGCIINTAMQQTSTPNVISITVNKQNYTEQMVKKSAAGMWTSLRTSRMQRLRQTGFLILQRAQMPICPAR